MARMAGVATVLAALVGAAAAFYLPQRDPALRQPAQLGGVCHPLRVPPLRLLQGRREQRAPREPRTGGVRGANPALALCDYLRRVEGRLLGALLQGLQGHRARGPEEARAAEEG